MPEFIEELMGDGEWNDKKLMAMALVYAKQLRQAAEMGASPIQILDVVIALVAPAYQLSLRGYTPHHGQLGKR